MDLNFTKRDYDAVVRIQVQVEKIKARMRERWEKHKRFEAFTLANDYQLEDDPVYLALGIIEAEAETIIELNY